MKKQYLLLCSFIFVFLFVVNSCKEEPMDMDDDMTMVEDDDTTMMEDDDTMMVNEDTTNNDPIIYPDAIPATPQNIGDAAAGWDYLRYANYVGGGFPFDLVDIFFGANTTNVLNREGDNATLGAALTAYDASNGVRTVTNNCFSCHGGYLNGEYVMGLGNSLIDLTGSQESIFILLENYIKNNYGEDSPEWENYEPFGRGFKAVSPYVVTDFAGVNSAFDLERAAVAHRNLDYTWNETPQFELPNDVVASDVPAWWLLKKKNALYYTGVGRGDFTKLLMQTSVVGITDSTEARNINENFDDVLAFIMSIEPPVYPEAIDEDLRLQGETVFNNNCQACHGTYGENETYPNRLISTDIVGTDPVYAERFFNDGLVNWFNEGWFGTTPGDAELVVEKAYIAPPLDGVWATAPYLHNGSIPNLYTLLNSAERPVYWERTFDSNDYDMQNVGWNYTEQMAGGDSKIYDTTINGYGNQGHTFGDGLSEEDRLALIEYLKSL